MREVAASIEPGAGYEALYREHGQQLWRSIFLFAGDREVASDAVIEAFAQAIARGDAIRSPLEWVTKAAFRIAAGELAGRRRPPVVLRHAVDEAVCDPEERGLPLREHLLRLSPKQRAAVILFDVEGYSSSEVADLIGSTTSAVGVHLHRVGEIVRSRRLPLVDPPYDPIFDIHAVSDDRVWGSVADNHVGPQPGSGTVFELDPLGRVRWSIDVGSLIGDVTYGDGSVWVGEGGGQRVVRIDPGS